MFLFKKQKKLDLLYRDNIKTGCKADSKEEAIRMAGQILVDTGYVDADYVDGMLEREKVFSTYMGGGLAIPHGVDEAKKHIKASGISVLFFQGGITWNEDGDLVKLVIGIAGVGEEHIDILAKVAEIMMDENQMPKLFSGDADKVYALLAERK